uniref:Uncharacterized protein n=1 Tax=Oryza glumipatula TaxID=40148 RepID=A0A0E0AUK7_9ORYZ
MEGRSAVVAGIATFAPISRIKQRTGGAPSPCCIPTFPKSIFKSETFGHASPPGAAGVQCCPATPLWLILTLSLKMELGPLWLIVCGLLFHRRLRLIPRFLAASHWPIGIQKWVKRAIAMGPMAMAAALLLMLSLARRSSSLPYLLAFVKEKMAIA